MILVDSSVWIAHLRGRRTPVTAKLEIAAGREPLLIGDLIMLEVLQGARDDSQAAQIERALRQYAVVSLLNADLVARRSKLSQAERVRHHDPKDGGHHYRNVLHRLSAFVAAR